MTAYRIGDFGQIVRASDGAIIPTDPDNSAYQTYLAWAKTNTPDPAPVSRLYDVAAAARYNAEISGITIDGVPVLTDRQSQALINGAVALAQINPTAVIRFKSGAGFVTLDAQNVIAIGLAVGTHVQTCFAREAEVSEEIAAGTLTTPAAVTARFADLVGN